MSYADILFHDFETKCELDLPKVGGFRYSQHYSFRPLLCSWAINEEKVNLWKPAEGEKIPRRLIEAVRDPKVQKRSWNAQFEKNTWRYGLGEEIYEDEWRCTMVQAMTLSMPGKLEKAAPVLDLPSDKQKDSRGKRLVNLFCKPHKPTKKHPYIWYNRWTHPEDWEDFGEYCTQDTVTERAIYKRIKKWDLPEDEWAMYHLDQEINRDGVPFNMRVVERAIEFVEYIKAKRYEEMRRITGIENPRSTVVLLKWLKKYGYRFDDLKKGHVQRAAADEELDEEVRDVLRMRVEVAKTSTDKYYAIKRAQVDGVVQGAFQFYGAQRTGRFSGRIFQPQNMARPHKAFEECQPDLVDHIAKLTNRQLELLYDVGDEYDAKQAGVMDMLSSATRPAIQAPEGEMIFSADASAIENRVLGYMAEDQKILDVFRKGRDPYVDFSSYLWGTTYTIEWERYKPEDGSKGNKDHRNIAKPGTLGCGYMLSAGEEHENLKTGEIEASGLLGYAWQMGILEFTLEDSEHSVKTWRGTFTDAVQYWWEIQKAAKRCIRTKKRTEAGPVEFIYDSPFLKMRLPSGRCLYYVRPRIETKEQFWCEKKRKFLPWHLCKQPNRDKKKLKENITYEGQDDMKRWVRINTHPGKLTENGDQGIARDVLKVGMQRFRARVPRREGRIRLHVHDEIVGFGPRKYAQRNYDILVECLSEEMPWASEKELPLGASGSITACWLKD